MKKPGLFPVRILMLGFVTQPNLQNNVSFLFENTIPILIIIATISRFIWAQAEAPIQA